MDPLLIMAAIVAAAFFLRRLKGGRSIDVTAALSPGADRPRCTQWEKSATAELLDEIALDEAKRALRKKLLKVLADQDEAEAEEAAAPAAAVRKAPVA